MRYFDRATETMPRDRLALLQLEKLQAMLAELWGRNAFYTDKLKRAGVGPDEMRTLAPDRGSGGLADLSRLPLTTKDELTADQAARPPFGTNLAYPPASSRPGRVSASKASSRPRFSSRNAFWDWWGRC